MKNITWKYVSPLKDDTAVEVLQIKYHYQLPKDLVDCIKENNGGIPSPDKFDLGNEKDLVFGGLLSFNPTDVDNIYDFIDLFAEEDGSGLRMFPFAIDPAGNFICMKNHKVVFYDHETDNVRNIADSYSIFLTMLHE